MKPNRRKKTTTKNNLTRKGFLTRRWKEYTRKHMRHRNELRNNTRKTAIKDLSKRELMEYTRKHIDIINQQIIEQHKIKKQNNKRLTEEEV